MVKWKYFFGGLLTGIVYFLVADKVLKLESYPLPRDSGRLLFKDASGTCFGYSTSESDCNGAITPNFQGGISPQFT